MTDSLHVLAGADNFDPRRRASDAQALTLARHRLIDGLRKAAQNGRWGKVHRLTLAYLNSDVARLSAACRAAPKMATDHQVREIACTANPFMGSDAVVSWHLEPKRSRTGYRIICDLPAPLKTIHYLIKDILAAVMQAPDHTFDIPGRGRDRAARAVKRALEEGYEWCFLGDVRDCYQHVSADALVSLLPLPRSVVRNTLDYRYLNLAHSVATSCNIDSYWARKARANGPRGLLQGSPASNIILAKLFCSLAEQIEPHDCTVINVSDNFLVAAKDHATLVAIIALLRGYLHGHRAGPFELKETSQMVEPGAPFEFMGYRFEWSGESVRVDIGEDRLMEFEDALEDAIAHDVDHHDDAASAATRLIMDFFGGYRAITNWEMKREELTLQVLDDVLYAGAEEFFDHLAARATYRPREEAAPALI